MTLEQQVSSREPSQRLKELGVKQESYFAYVNTQEGGEPHLLTTLGSFVGQENYVSAFTVAELGNILGRAQQGDLIEAYVRTMDVTFAHVKENIALCMHNVMTQPDVAAQMAIYLLENKLITV